MANVADNIPVILTSDYGFSFPDGFSRHDPILVKAIQTEDGELFKNHLGSHIRESQYYTRTPNEYSVVYLAPGTKYTIVNYDGLESIITESDLNMTAGQQNIIATVTIDGKSEPTSTLTGTKMAIRRLGSPDKTPYAEIKFMEGGQVKFLCEESMQAIMTEDVVHCETPSFMNGFIEVYLKKV